MARAASEAYRGKNGFVQLKPALRNTSVVKNDELKVVEVQDFTQFMMKEMGDRFPT